MPIKSPLRSEIIAMGFCREPDGDNRDKRHPNQISGNRPRISTGPFEQSGRDERRESAGEYRGQLVAERGAAVAHARAEEFGEKGRLRTVHRRVADQSRSEEHTSELQSRGL